MAGVGGSSQVLRMFLMDVSEVVAGAGARGFALGG